MTMMKKASMKSQCGAAAVLVCAALSVMSCTDSQGKNGPDRLLPLLAGAGKLAGVYDESFNAGGSGLNGMICTIAVQTDGKILVGGDFSSYNGSSDISKCIIRLNADGTLDDTFNSGGSGANNTIYAIVVQGDGKILVGGSFTQYNGVDVSDGIIRLTADGTVEDSFNDDGSGANGAVYAVALLDSGDILIGGNFTTYNGSDAPDRIARLGGLGELDSGFNGGSVGANDYVSAIAVQDDAMILIGGKFTFYNTVDVPNGIIRLQDFGWRDATFNGASSSGANDNVNAVALQPDGKVVIGGRFTSYGPAGTLAPDNILRLNGDGLVDDAFAVSGVLEGGTQVNALALMKEGRIMVGGTFSTYHDDAAAPDNLMMLNSDGTLDDSFNAGGSGTNGYVSAIAVQANGRVIVGGDFTTYNGVSVPAGLIRLK